MLDEQGLPVPDPNFEAKQKAAMLAYFNASSPDGYAAEDFDEPNMYATDPGWFRDLSARIPGLLVHSAGGMVPFQSEGTLHGFPYYFRYRHGYAQLRVMDPAVNEDEATLFEHLYSTGMEYGDKYDGALDRDEFCHLMLTLVPQLERGPYQWSFAGVRVDVVDDANPRPATFTTWDEELAYLRSEKNPPQIRYVATTTPEVYKAWGTTPAEAYERLHEVSEWLVEKGISAEDQQTHDRLKAIDPTPLNTDERVFPDPEPVFTVRDA